MLRLERVFYRYPQSTDDVIADLSCQFSPGECVAVTGRNGCGKTTLVRLLTGILRPDRGRILLDDNDLTLQKNKFNTSLHVAQLQNEDTS